MTAAWTIGLVSILISTWAAGPALACSPPPGDVVEFYARKDSAYLERVTSIYSGVLRNVVGRQDDPVVTFSVRKSVDLWGEAGPNNLDLEFQNGHCSDYRIFMADYPEGRPLADGLPVRVFVTPQSRAAPDLLYILPEGPDAEQLMMRWRAIRTQPARH